MRPTIASLAAIVLLAGACAPRHLDTIRRAEAALTGAPVDRLDRCIGAPAVSPAQAGDHARVYSSAQPRDAGGWTLPDPAAAAAPRACVLEATIRDGTITAVRMANRGGWGFGRIARCSALVAACTGQ